MWLKQHQWVKTFTLFLWVSFQSQNTHNRISSCWNLRNKDQFKIIQILLPFDQEQYQGYIPGGGVTFLNKIFCFCLSWLLFCSRFCFFTKAVFKMIWNMETHKAAPCGDHGESEPFDEDSNVIFSADILIPEIKGNGESCQLTWNMW